MIIGVMSDTHGHLTEMRRAASRMLEEFNVDVIVHLGDDSTDADELKHMADEVMSVPGIFEKRYKDQSIPNRIIKEFKDIPFLLTHTPTTDGHDLPDDINPTEAAQDGDARAILYGHTHIFDAREKHGAIYINPGHLKPKDNRSDVLTFAILDVDPPRLHIRIINLNGGVELEKTFFIEE